VFSFDVVRKSALVPTAVFCVFVEEVFKALAPTATLFAPVVLVKSDR